MTALLGSTLKVSLVVFAGLGVAALLRNRSAAARHWAIAASLLCAMALPALELIVPAWGVLAPRVTPATQVAPRVASPDTPGAVTRDAAPIDLAGDRRRVVCRQSEGRPVTSGHASLDDWRRP